MKTIPMDVCCDYGVNGSDNTGNEIVAKRYVELERSKDDCKNSNKPLVVLTM